MSKKKKVGIVTALVLLCLVMGGGIRYFWNRYWIDTSLKKIGEYNLLTYHSFEYGYDGGRSILNDVLEYGIGSCDQYANLLYDYLKREGYRCRIVGVLSYFREGNHAMLEVELRGKWYLFDPTNAIYYKNSLDEIRKNPKLSNKKVVQTSDDIPDSFTQEQFFKEIYQTIVEEGRPAYMKDLKDEIKENQYGELMDRDIYTCYETESLDEVITFKFKKEVNIGYIGILWLWTIEAGKDIAIEYWNKEVQAWEGIEESLGIFHYYENYLKNPFKTDQLRLVVNSTYGEERIAIRELYIYEAVNH